MLRRFLVTLLVVCAAGLAGCTYWGTSQLQTTQVWWECTDPHGQCSNPGMQLIQMDNTDLGARIELCRAESTLDLPKPLFTSEELRPLREAVAESKAARERISSTAPTWNADLVKYTKSAVRSERLANKLGYKLYPMVGYTANGPTVQMRWSGECASSVQNYSDHPPVGTASTSR